MLISPETSKLGGGDLIPKNTLAMAHVKLQAIGNSQNTGGEYAKLELTIVSGPYAKRKVFTVLGNPDDKRNSDKFREMGQGAITRMFEAMGVCKPGDLASYAAINDFLQAMEGAANLSEQGRYVAVKIGFEEGKDGYQDKNTVANFLSPAPMSGSVKDWNKLQAEIGGATLTAPAVAAPAAGFGGGFAAAKPAGNVLAAPSWATPAAKTAEPVTDDEIPF